MDGDRRPKRPAPPHTDRLVSKVREWRLLIATNCYLGTRLQNRTPRNWHVFQNTYEETFKILSQFTKLGSISHLANGQFYGFSCHCTNRPDAQMLLPQPAGNSAHRSAQNHVERLSFSSERARSLQNFEKEFLTHALP